MSDNFVIEAQGVSKTYDELKSSLCVFSDIDFTLNAGESVAILGASGAGKSTLLNILGGLDKPSSGKIRLCGHELETCSDRELSALRNQYLGFVYQFHHLLAEFSAMENVAMPLYIAGMSRRKAHSKALELLNQVGLTERSSHRPAELSGGERQRVAIARALVNEPRCVLMDEPTGNLDEKTARKIQDIMVGLKDQVKTSFVVVTHDTRLAERMDKMCYLESGTLKSSAS